MGEVTAEYVDVFCKSGAFIGCDDFPDYVSLHPGYPLNLTVAAGFCLANNPADAGGLTCCFLAEAQGTQR